VLACSVPGSTRQGRQKLLREFLGPEAIALRHRLVYENILRQN
jgi:hypothetical protein